MYIIFALCNEVSPNFSFSKVLVSWDIFVDFYHVVFDILDIFKKRIKIWNLTIVKNVIDIFKEGFHNDLSIIQKEYSLVLINSALEEESLSHVFSPFKELV